MKNKIKITCGVLTVCIFCQAALPETGDQIWAKFKPIYSDIPKHKQAWKYLESCSPEEIVECSISAVKSFDEKKRIGHGMLI